MAHTLATMRARVIARSTTDTNDTLLTSAQINLYINQALQQMSLEADWPWQKVTDYAQALLSGASSFTPGTGWYRTVSLTNATTGEPLVRYAPKVLDRYIGQGRPILYAPDGLIVRTAPAADQAYTLIHRYFRHESVLSADGDTPLIPEVYSQAVIEWAAYQALTQGNSVERADRALRDFRASLQRIKDNANQGSDPLRVSNRPGGWL